ncbi:MAG: hypothetical protein DI535_06150 [Citrobacter freundii]|nr:MAG: hypothetical protein DI535_06150 [Citrobacter freundii]
MKTLLSTVCLSLVLLAFAGTDSNAKETVKGKVYSTQQDTIPKKDTIRKDTIKRDSIVLFQ